LKYSSQVIPFTKDEFIHHIKTNDGFAKLWGLKIEERELSFDERLKLANIEKPNSDNMMVFLDYVYVMDNRNIPTKLITITYNDKKIESYE
jgi:hypothetical protein